MVHGLVFLESSRKDLVIVPTTLIYIDINGYITPNERKECYETELDTLENTIVKEFNSSIKNRERMFENNAICIFDIAKKRMSFKKKSFFSVQLFLKLKNEFVQKNNSSFPLIAKSTEIKKFTTDNDLDKLFGKYGFAISKTKH